MSVQQTITQNKEAMEEWKNDNFGAMTTLELLMSDWKHCEDQQKEIIFHLFPEH